MRIDDVRIYEIQIQGQVEEADINATSPLRVTIEQSAKTNTSALLRADQSGLIGVIRHLHGLGIVLRSIHCVAESLPDPDLDTKLFSNGKERKMNKHASAQKNILWLTVPIAILLAIAAGCGMLINGLYRDVPDLVAQAQGQDLVSLAVTLPILVIAALLARRGSLRARFTWLGGLAYLMYTYASFAFAIRYNPLFLVYIALLGCSLYGLIGGLATLDMAEIKAQFTEKTPTRVVSVFIALLAFLFYSLWLSELIPALIAGKVPQSILETGTPTNVIHVLDMAWILPAFIITSISLWRKQSLGYASAGIMLTFFVLLASATLSMALFELQGGNPDAPMMAGFFGVLISIAAGMLFWYLKSLCLPYSVGIEVAVLSA